MTNDIYLPVEKLPVPPDKTDLMMIRLLDSSFVKQNDGTIQEFRKIYYETYFQGKKVSDGNNTIPASLVPLIYNASSHKEMMDLALQQFGFKLIQEVFDEKPNVFENPYAQNQIITNNLLPPLPQPTNNNVTEQEQQTTQQPASNEPNSNTTGTTEPVTTTGTTETPAN